MLTADSKEKNTSGKTGVTKRPKPTGRTKQAGLAGGTTSHVIASVSPEIVEQMQLSQTKPCHVTEDLPVYLL